MLHTSLHRYFTSRFPTAIKGLIRRYDYNQINTARDVVKLANILHLNQLRIDINGQFVSSRKHLKDNEHNKHPNVLQNDSLNEWKALKLKTFDFDKWNDHSSTAYFFNINILYHFDEQMYANIGCRQMIKINVKMFQISKVIFVSVSKYFEAMFGGKIWAESQQNDSNQNTIEMKQIKAYDFEKLQRFLYTFD